MEGQYSPIYVTDCDEEEGENEEDDNKKYGRRKLKIKCLFEMSDRIEYVLIFLSYVVLSILVNDLTAAVYTYFHGADLALIIGKAYGLMLSIGFALLIYSLQKRRKICLILAAFSIIIMYSIWSTLFHISAKDNGHNHIQNQSEISSYRFPTDDIQTVVMSLPVKNSNGNCRRNYMEKMLNNNQIPFQFVDALDVSNVDPSQIALAQFYGMSKSAVMIQSMVISMKEGAKMAANSTTWLLVLEDDASLPPSFSKKIRDVIENEKHKNHDVIWLDVRTYPAYAVSGYITCCTAGMLYRKESIPKIVEYLETRKQEVADYIKQRNGSFPLNDFLLAYLCNKKLYSCTVVPMIAEAGFPSDH